MIFVKHSILIVVFSVFMMLGCGSDSDSSPELDSDFDIEVALESENTQVSKLVQNFEGLDNSVERMLPLIESNGFDLSNIEEIDPMLLSSYYSSSSFDELHNVQEKMLEETGNILSATEELVRLEEQVYLYDETQATTRAVPLVVAGIGALTILEIGVSCSDQWYGNYSNCYNTKMAGDCNIYNEENEIVGTRPCKDVILSNVGIGGSCAMEATMKLEKCKESATVNILTSLSKDAVSFLSPPTAGALTIKTTVDDVKSISKGTSSIIAQWKKNCEASKESLSKSIARADEKEYIYLTQSNDGNLELPSGYWYITAFTQGAVRENRECIEVKDSESKVVELNSIDESVVQEENEDSTTDEDSTASEDKDALPSHWVIYHRPDKSDCESGGGTWNPSSDGDTTLGECSASGSAAVEICDGWEAFVTTDSYVRCGK